MTPNVIRFCVDAARLAVAMKHRLMADELRRAVTKEMHVKQFGNVEDAVTDAVSPMFDDQIGEASRNLLGVRERGASSAGKNVEDVAASLTSRIFDPSEWDAELVDRVYPPLATAMGEAAVTAQLTLGHDPRVKGNTTASEWIANRPDIALENVVFTTPFGDVSMGIATEWPLWMQETIQEQLNVTFAQPYWREVNKTTKGDIEQFLQRGLREGQSIETIARSMESQLVETGRYARRRGRAIARTESGNALNGARRASIDQLSADLGPDTPLTPAWLSVLGNTTRDTHAALDGVPADAEGLWPLGGVRVPWPSHVSLPVGERVNCQCTVVTQFGEAPQARPISDGPAAPVRPVSPSEVPPGEPIPPGGLNQAVARAESDIRDELIENLRVFDRRGRQISSSRGTEDSITLTTEVADSMENAITLHNHPRYPDGTVTSFSVSDIAGGIERREFQTRIITQNGDRFSMGYGSKLEGLSLRQRQSLGRKISRDYGRVYKEQAREWATKVAQGEASMVEGVLGMSDSSWEIVAKKHGLSYNRL